MEGSVWVPFNVDIDEGAKSRPIALGTRSRDRAGSSARVRARRGIGTKLGPMLSNMHATRRGHGYITFIQVQPRSQARHSDVLRGLGMLDTVYTRSLGRRGEPKKCASHRKAHEEH